MTGDPTLDMLQFATRTLRHPDRAWRLRPGNHPPRRERRFAGAAAAIIHGLIGSARTSFSRSIPARARGSRERLWHRLEEARPQIELLPALGMWIFFDDWLEPTKSSLIPELCVGRRTCLESQSLPQLRSTGGLKSSGPDGTALSGRMPAGLPRPSAALNPP